jgi:hypothetical protein
VAGNQSTGALGDPSQGPGWNVQASIVAPGYAQPGVGGLPATTVGIQSGSGTAYPPSNNTSASNDEPILENPGYAQPGLVNGSTQAVTPVPASGTAFSNPFPVLSLLTVTGWTVSEIAVAPYGSTSYANIEAGDSAPVTVPGAASVKITYSVAPTSITFTAAA